MFFSAWQQAERNGCKKKVFDDFSFKDFVSSDMRRGGGVAKQTML